MSIQSDSLQLMADGEAAAMDIFLIGVGVACVLAAIAGGSLKAAGVEIPALHNRLQYALFAIIGAALFALGLYIHYQKPVGPPAGIAITMNTIGPMTAPTCPANLKLSGSITIEEGRGTVVFHSVYVPSGGTTTDAGSQLSVYFSEPGTQSIQDTTLVQNTLAGNYYWQVDSPVVQGSNSEPFSVTCLG
jgi:hypothetical protein